jgi:hypothetical protein
MTSPPAITVVIGNGLSSLKMGVSGVKKKMSLRNRRMSGGNGE